MHSNPGTIVVGIDGSEPSIRALRWATRQAVSEHRPLTLVHTVNAVTPAFTDAAIADASRARSLLETAGRSVLEVARAGVERDAPGLEVHEIFDLADPRDALLQLAEGAAMVVVGSRGRGQVRSLLLGSVGVALVRHAHCPVVVIRPEVAGAVRHGVVVGLDTTQMSRQVLEFAFRQASLHDLPLTILHCMWDIQAGTTGAYLVADELSDAESERLGLSEATAGMAEKYPDVHVTSRLSKGLPDQVLAHLSDKMDLIVVGAHRHGIFQRAIAGSVSTSVVEHAHCPVAVVPVTEDE